MIDTINVIEIADDDLQSLRAFPDDEEGNAKAEELFSKVAKENGAHDDELPAFLEEGYYETGNYQLFLVHSDEEQP